MDQDVRVLEFGPHLLGVGDEIGRDVAAVELHTLDHLELGGQALGLLDRDHALVADLLHRLGQHLADFGITVGRDCADLGDLFRGRDLLGPALDVLDDRLDREVDAALQVHRIHAGRHGLAALADNSRSKDGGRGGAVADQVAGLGRHLAHHLRAHVLELVGELDLLGDRHAVLGDPRRAEALVEHDVAALRAQRHLHRVGEDGHTFEHPGPSVGRKPDFLGSHL